MTFCREIVFLILICVLPKLALSQLCQGSLGDPLVNIDFGSGPNPGLPLNSTTYNYVNSGCPNDGSYTMANLVNNCFSGSWHSLTEDHTPNDVNGYMMVVNASIQPGDFFVQRVDNLCENTTYEFAAWMLNLHRGMNCANGVSLPNVSFKIETLSGTVLMSYETGDVPSTTAPEWKQYGKFFTLPAGYSSVVVRMTNNAPGGCGNDLVLDDITFRACGPVIHTFVDDIEKSQENICEGENKAMKVTVAVPPSYLNPKFLWQSSTDGITWADMLGYNTPEIDISFMPAIAGTYKYRVVMAETANFGSANCRVASNPITLQVNPNPIAQASNNGPVCISNSLELSASGGSQYVWQGPNGFSSTLQNPVIPSASQDNAGMYSVTVSSLNCSDVATTEVTIKPSLIADAGANVEICKGSNIQLNASGGDFYQWTPITGLSDASISNPTANPEVTTTYTVLVSKAGICPVTDEVTVKVAEEASADAGKDFKILQGQAVQLQGKTAGSDISFFWSPADYLDDPTILNPIATPLEDITYTLNVISNKGCPPASDQLSVRVFKEVVIPNTFSPNGDGINDTWSIYPLEEFKKLSLRVFNRFGNEVYKCLGEYLPWDGTFEKKNLPAGTYYYKLDFGNKEMPIASGWVMIVR